MFACKNESKVTTEVELETMATQAEIEDTSNMVEEKKVTSFDITMLEEFPEEIDGCSCYFATTEDNFKEQKYLLIDDWAQTAFMMINGKKVTFLQKDLDKPTENKAITLYKSTKYNLMTNLDLNGTDMDGVEKLSGKLIVSDNEGNSKTIEIFGECGC